MTEAIVIVESRADAMTATKLAERVIIDRVDWIDSDNIEYFVKWTGLEAETRFSCWKDTGKIIENYKEAGVRVPRFLSRSRRTDSSKADEAATMKILHLVRALSRNRDIKAVIFIRDLDCQPERRQGIEGAREEHVNVKPPLAIVVGTAERTREAWVLNGFIPMSIAEEKNLADLKTQLTFDPCDNAHKLRSNSFAEADRDRNPKVVLDILTNENWERQSQCWEETELDILRSRGEHTGLTNYLKEIEHRLIPAIVN
jgi:hypothetical protein